MYVNLVTQAVHRAVVEARLTNIGEVMLYVSPDGAVSADEEIPDIALRVELNCRATILTDVMVEYVGGDTASVERIQVGGTNISAITEVVKTLIGIAYSELFDGESLEWD